jgi:hypothetical protein
MTVTVRATRNFTNGWTDLKEGGQMLLTIYVPLWMTKDCNVLKIKSRLSSTSDTTQESAMMKLHLK